MSEPNQTAQPAEEMSEQQLSELLQIRRDKLQALQEAGIPLAAADTSVSRIEAARMLYRVSRLPK